MKSSLIIFLGLTLLHFPHTGLAQSLGTLSEGHSRSFNQRYNFKHLNVQNGLTQNIVYHFLQDSHGYMWIGTHHGLSLYDGIKTTNFLHNEQDTTSIAGNFISSILEDFSHRIWISNENGIDVYNRNENSFSHFAVDRPDGTKDNTYCVLLGFVSANELWFLDTKTRSVMELNLTTKRSSYIAPLNSYHALLYKGSGQTIHIWSAYDKGTIHQVYKNKKLSSQQTYFSGKSGAITDPQLEVIHVFQQSDTIVWLSTNKGLVKLDPVLNTYRVFDNWQGETVRELRYAALSPKGHLWVSSGPAGVYVFDVNTNQFIANLRNNKLELFSICSDNIVSLYFDKTGNIWCGSYGNGSSFASVENNFFTSHLSKDETRAWNANNNIDWLGADFQGNPWCMFTEAPGFWILDKNLKVSKHRLPLLENGNSFNAIVHRVIFDTGDAIWCGTNKGVYRYDISTNTMHPVKYELISEEFQGSGWIRDMIQLRDSSIIFSTFVGLYRLTNKSGKHVIKPITFLKAGAYTGFGPLFQDRANLVYVKTLGDSLFILRPAAEEKDYRLVDSMRFMPNINSYFNEKNDSLIYLATTNGLYHISSNNFKIEKEEFSKKLPFLSVRSVFKKDNKYWIFGEKGLYFFDDINKQGRTYTVEDGLPSNEFSLTALIHSRDGRCISATSNGIVSFFPDQKQDSIYPPRPRITNIYVNDIIHPSIRNPSQTKKIDLSYKENTFSFDFAPIAFQHSAESSFEFKLEEYDETWVKSDVAHYTRYSKIPPGKYVFKLRAIDAMGRASPYTTSLEIEIAKTFWQTAYFRLAALAVVILIGWLLSKWYLRYKIKQRIREFEKQQAIEKERTRIATDMHDDLGSGLSRIKFLSQALSNKKASDEAIKSGLEKITDYSDEMTEKMGEIVWALNEKNDTLADLVAYTRSYALEYLANHDIPCEMNTPMQLPGTFITGEMRRNIFLSVKECLHNIVKHSSASLVYFSIELNGKIEIVIHDNGKGIDWKNRRPFSNGLQNIEKRMKEINGEVSFVNDQGTKVLLKVPFNL